jgi:EmrB/QacA subfamily drug resistance transporter
MPSAAPAETPALTRAQLIFTLVGALLALFLAALDQTVVATAGPQIQRALHIEPALYTWLTTSYLVASTVLVPVYGRLSDAWGRKPLLLGGIALFLAGSVLCALSTTTAQLVAFRALQGAGAASLFTMTFAVVGDLFPPKERGKYSGIFGSVFGLSSLVGPLLGGFITDHFGWHWVFLINLPLGLLAFAFIAWRMPALRPAHGGRPQLDVPGVALLIVTVVPLLLALSLGRAVPLPGDGGFPWLSAPVLGLFAGSLVGLVIFVVHQRQAARPLFDLSLFQVRTVAWGCPTVFVLGAAFLTPMIFLPLFMVNVVGVTATASGLTISPLVLSVVAGNVLSGQLVSRLGHYRLQMLGSLVLLAAGFAVMAFTLIPQSTQGEVTLKMILLGLGLGPSIPLYTLALQNAVPPAQLGVVTSMTTFSRQMGSTVGVAVMGSLFASTLAGTLQARVEAATSGLPPAMVERFNANAPATEEGAPVAPQQAAAAMKTRLEGQLEGAAALARRALNGELMASKLVESSPLTPERVRAAVMNGGPRTQVKRSFESMRHRLEAAAQSPESFRAFLSSPEVYPGLKARLAGVAPASLSEPGARANVVAQGHQVLDEEEPKAEETAFQQALAATDQALADTRAKVFAALDGLENAKKEAFTTALTRVFSVGIAIAVLAFVLTLRLPQLTLRGRGPTPTGEP